MNDDEFWGTGTNTFSAEQIKALTGEQYRLFRDRLLDAARENQRAATITIPMGALTHIIGEALTCMWCAGGPYPDIEALEQHEEECR